MNLLHKKYNLTTQIESKHRFCIDIVFHFLDISYLLRFPAVDTQNSALKNKNEKKNAITYRVDFCKNPPGRKPETDHFFRMALAAPKQHFKGPDAVN